MINWKTWMVWWSLLFSVTTAEFFTSLSRIKGLVRLESALSNSLDNYLEQMSEPPEVLRQFADRVRKEMKIAAGDIEKYAFHPINSFLLVRRFVRHWTELATFLSEGSPNGKETAAVGCERISTSPYCHPTYPVCSFWRFKYKYCQEMTRFKIKICMREILTSYCFCPDLYRLKRYRQFEKTCKIKDEKKKKKKRCCSLPRQLPERVQYIFYALIEKIPTIFPEAGDYVFCYTSQLQSADHANQYANHIRTLELFIFSTLAGTQVSPRF